MNFRICCAALMLLTSCTVLAKGSSHRQEDEEQRQNNTSIITPDIASGSAVFYYELIGSNGDILICDTSKGYDADLRDGTCLDKYHANKWATMKNVVPVGKKYAGFLRHRTTVEVFWK